ncbi:peptide ABC transporter substrate-binding protein [Rhodococcoides trifolii]|uniref:Peptide ABC transporter substrate-binding protein n=1 Tax=Rhodococcoides trifolii TaxID=908250 RepID=A0A917G270_9NOCA|nr:ABC transporter substrate-binding protein [Rhodococcus trifolii]GGG19192.1 peptide ABC transporter substrate-binding protein [Rhodococcus trifolii]
MITACGGSGGSDGGSGGGGGGIVTVNGSEPQNPLVPTNTNENGGGRIVDRLFAGLTSYDAKGVPSNEVADSIDTSDNVNYDIKIKPDWKFTDGTTVTAKSFVDAWNYGALGSNAQLQQSFFEPILGYDEVSSETPTAQTMSGLKVVSDTEFTVQLKQPTIDFELRLAFTPFYPLPEAAFADMAAFGENPIGNGPYKLAGPGAWQHNVRIDLVPNEDYAGNRVPKNSGLGVVFYSSLDTAYADLQSDNLDVLDTIPPSALPTYESDLGDRAIQTPTAQNTTITIPSRLEHFSGQEGNLRRQALSLAINRDQITEQIFQGTRKPLDDFTASTLPGHSDSIAGNDVLKYNPDQAKALWAQADAISPWSGQFQVGYNADGGHQEWVDAMTNSIRNTLGIEAVGAPQPTFAQIRTQITNRTISTAFRTGWQGDYPSLLEFLEPIFVTGAGSNDGDYSNPAFDAALRDAEAAPDAEASYALTNKAQEILMQDLPAIPLWDYVNATGISTLVGDVATAWNGLPDYENITKS